MNQKYKVIMFYENGNQERAFITSNSSAAVLEDVISKNNWLKCEDIEVFYNLNKVLYFELEKVTD